METNVVTTTAHVNGNGPFAQGNALADALRHIAVDRTLSNFVKDRQIADLVRAELQRRGSFYRTHGGRVFYFPDSERRLLDLHGQRFILLLKELTGLAGPDRFSPFVLDHLRTEAARSKSIETQALAYHDPRTSLSVVSDGGRAVWIHESHGEWTRGLNGDQGIFFITDSNGDSWEPEMSPRDQVGVLDNLDWFVRQFPFTASRSRLSAEDQISLLSIFLVHSFSPALTLIRK